MNKNTSRKKCIHCGQLILRKISKFDGTICQILRLECTKFDFCWGSAPDPVGRAYSAPQTVFKRLTSKGREGVKGTGGIGKGKGLERRERGRKGEGEERARGRRGERICRTDVKLLPTRLSLNVH